MPDEIKTHPVKIFLGKEECTGQQICHWGQSALKCTLRTWEKPLMLENTQMSLSAEGSACENNSSHFRLRSKYLLFSVAHCVFITDMLKRFLACASFSNVANFEPSSLIESSPFYMKQLEWEVQFGNRPALYIEPDTPCYHWWDGRRMLV